jgi:hypothetical protein
MIDGSCPFDSVHLHSSFFVSYIVLLSLSVSLPVQYSVNEEMKSVFGPFVSIFIYHVIVTAVPIPPASLLVTVQRNVNERVETEIMGPGS